MQKKIIALAIAAAISSPAFADTSNVTVYGKLNADFESVRTSAVTAPLTNVTSLNRVATNASRFGIKGTEDLGDGLKAIWQYEAQFDLNGNATATQAGFGNGTRNSHVGLQGNFGTAFLGIWDTPFKVSHNKVEIFDNTHFASAINVLGRTTAGVSFNTRLVNSVQYWSPKFSGFQVNAAFGTDNAQVVASNQSVSSLSATYEDDMFYAAYGYLSLNDKAAATVAKGNKTDGSRLVGAFKFADGQVGLTYEQLNSKTAAGVSSKRNAYELSGMYKIGANNLGLSYTVAGNEGAALTGNNGAKQLSLRYGYNFSKRTEAYAMYSALTNDVKGAYNFSAGNIVAGSAIGAKLTGFGAGLVHTF